MEAGNRKGLLRVREWDRKNGLLQVGSRGRTGLLQDRIGREICCRMEAKIGKGCYRTSNGIGRIGLLQDRIGNALLQDGSRE
jgi:hypothetical protein